MLKFNVPVQGATEISSPSERLEFASSVISFTLELLTRKAKCASNEEVLKILELATAAMSNSQELIKIRAR